MLASAGVEGCSEAIMKAHGFTTEQLVELVRAGLVTATSQGVHTGRERMQVAVLRITAEGRQALVTAKAWSSPAP